MFKHILTPLDGSRLAEAVLPATETLALCSGALVTLYHVIERRAPSTVHGERHLGEVADAEAYLQKVAERLRSAGVRAEYHVHTDKDMDVTESIVAHAQELKADLITLCTHGNSGLRRQLFGSIAQQVVARDPTPVLLVQPTPSGAAPRFATQKLLVPLDGSPEREFAVPLASSLAQICGSVLYLVAVVPTWNTVKGKEAAARTLLPSATSYLLDLSEQQVREYLQQLSARLSDAGIATNTQVRRGDPVQAVETAVAEMKPDLIIMATHGLSGLEALWSGSMMQQLAGRLTQPLLLVRIPDKG